MRKLMVSGLAAVAMVGALAGPAAAKDGDVIVRGRCSAASTYKLKLSDEDGRIETEYEVDQNRNNRTWDVKISVNGVVKATAVAVTRAPSGSFTVRRVLANGAGNEVVVAKATNRLSGETCTATATWTA